MDGKGSLMSWLLPALGNALALGLMGIVLKYALKTITWQQAVLWVPLAYAAIALVLIFGFGTRFPVGVGGAWAALTAVLAAAALVLVFVALDRGKASIVVPVTSIYPIVTLVGSAVFLAEGVTVPKVVGTLLVVAGATLVTR